ncbi:formylglycine-generating enzyme family protein [Pseudoruegeria sp. SHC-113]|uniref:formylglycine-generating enzyme family protein n=1 Tax=Pseudoruegeria sp. SHC-113 TaxID=2855439 RepID=UPI0021BADA88|nr:formylglycine-generating enzyme family protein [Pseudoruegeria sp. SHC-113]MCT8159953.1 formylglycine-generating enzyme family protein [Pseudoruegeria sp. SHC-113]
MAEGCCPPGTGGSVAPAIATAQPVDASIHHQRNCAPVPGGRAQLGTRDPVIPGDCEGPPQVRKIPALWWGKGAISVAQFARFVAATGHVTLAERLGWSFVFHTHVPGGAAGTLGVAGLEWWRRIDGATWARPCGPQGAEAAGDLPATHIAWEDARAFAAWAGGRLPREIEWEHAARGGLGDVRFPWGDAPPDDTAHFPCNIWQGDFPHQNTAADGHDGPAPVLAFAPNGYGLHQMVGNVWEWTAEPFRLRSLSRSAKPANAAAARAGQKLLKGGSFLCHESYCYRYRIPARTGNTPDSTSAHTGFRVVYDSPPA